MKSQTVRNQSQGDEATTQEAVQQRAYELYQKRGQEPGHELEDWLQAERDIRGKQKQIVGSR